MLTLLVMNIMQTKKGFTLIELLVVIAIIGLLSSVVLASLSTAREKSRDARRLSDIGQFQTALELYADENNGSYPLTAAGLDQLVTDGFMPSRPTDPQGNDYTYTSADGSTYCLSIDLERTGAIPDTNTDCDAGANFSINP